MASEPSDRRNLLVTAAKGVYLAYIHSQDIEPRRRSSLLGKFSDSLARDPNVSLTLHNLRERLEGLREERRRAGQPVPIEPVPGYVQSLLDLLDAYEVEERLKKIPQFDLPPAAQSLLELPERPTVIIRYGKYKACGAWGHRPNRVQTVRRYLTLSGVFARLEAAKVVNAVHFEYQSQVLFTLPDIRRLKEASELVDDPLARQVACTVVERLAMFLQDPSVAEQWPQIGEEKGAGAVAEAAGLQWHDDACSCGSGVVVGGGETEMTTGTGTGTEMFGDDWESALNAAAAVADEKVQMDAREHNHALGGEAAEGPGVPVTENSGVGCGEFAQEASGSESDSGPENVSGVGGDSEEEDQDNELAGEGE